MAQTEKHASRKDVLFWFIGGTLGIFLSFVVSMDIIFNLRLPSQEVYEAIFHVCMIMVVLSVFFGGILGMMAGKTVFFLREVYKQGKKAKKQKR